MAKQNTKNKKRIREILQRKRKNFTIFVFVFAILLSVVFTEISYILYKITYLKIIDAQFEVSNTIGFALGKEELNFGIISPGGSATRYINVENYGAKSLMLQIAATGTIKDFISYNNSVLIQSNETKQLSFKVFVPETTQKGRYAGKIFLIFKRT